MLPRPPPGDVANTLTHAVGWLLSIGGAAALMVRVIPTGEPWRIAGCGVFAAALAVVYAASTLSHAVSEPQWRRWYRSLDQGTIYLLIVGTYTPWALVFLRTPLWWLYYAAMWAIAGWGLVMKLVLVHRVDAVTLWSYVLLGWMPVVPMAAMYGTLPTPALAWVLAGGLCYTAGTLFVRWDNPRYHSHAIWHLLALAGSTCHFVSIYLYVARVPSAAS
jgi:hemolysin III